MSLNLNTELFLIPSEPSYLVYAPRRNYVMRLDTEGVNLLARLKRRRPKKEDINTDLVKALTEAGIINGKPEQKIPTAVGTPFAPTRVTLLLTTRCNLACKYCYAGDQNKEIVMPLEVGMAAIDFVAANCTAKGKKVLELGFHGGGEPTMAWAELTSLLQHARKAASKHMLKLRAGIATNAFLSAHKAEWITRNFSNVNVSLDGPPRIQNAMRPTKSGGPTSGIVKRTLKIFESAGTQYGLQATVTKENVHEMANIVRYISRYLKPTLVKLEPVSDCGRYYGYRDKIPAGRDFARYFNEAYEVGVSKGLHVAFSGIRLFGPGLSYFCGAFGEPFAVTPDGYLSACYEVYSAKTLFSKTFLFGRYHKATQSFKINKNKLESLRKRNIYALRSCRKCFCKYSCAGDCATRNFRYAGENNLKAVGARCEAIREITRHRLARFVDGAKLHVVKKGGKTDVESREQKSRQ